METDRALNFSVFLSSPVMDQDAQSVQSVSYLPDVHVYAFRAVQEYRHDSA